MTQVLDLVDTELDQSADSNNNHFAHYTDSASATEGYIMGTPVVALCGKVFIPHRDPEKLPICPSCKDIMDALFLSNE